MNHLRDIVEKSYLEALSAHDLSSLDNVFYETKFSQVLAELLESEETETLQLEEISYITWKELIGEYCDQQESTEVQD